MPRFTDAMQATRIQRAWRRAAKFVDILRNFLDHGPTKTNTASLGCAS